MPVQPKLNNRMLNSLPALSHSLQSHGQCLLLLLLHMALLPLALVKLRRHTTTPISNQCLMHNRLVTTGSPLPGVHRLHEKLMRGVSWLRSMMLMRSWPLPQVLGVGLVLVCQLTSVAPLMAML